MLFEGERGRVRAARRAESQSSCLRATSASEVPRLRKAATMSARCQPEEVMVSRESSRPGKDGYFFWSSVSRTRPRYPQMSKNQPHNGEGSDHRGGNLRKNTSRRLKYTDVKARLDDLRDVPLGGELPDWSALTIGNRFAVALRLIPKELRESALQRSGKQIDRYESADTDDPKAPKIPDQVLAALAAHAKLPASWLADGQAVDRMPPVTSGTTDELLAPDGDVPLQKLAFKVSAGHGALTIDESSHYVRFPRAILDHIGVKAANARLMESSGLSMWPTIDDGDMMVVDVSDTAVADGRIYVFSNGGETFVKRLLRNSSGVVMMRSDNRDLFPNDAPVDSNGDFRIFGRVRWTGRSL
ncbi:S24 family peptidase [Rhodopseudomonas pseudopalustris]